jgi:hypothetical protein
VARSSVANEAEELRIGLNSHWDGWEESVAFLDLGMCRIERQTEYLSRSSAISALIGLL